MLPITLAIGLIVIILAVLCIIYNNKEIYSKNSISSSDIDMENKIQLLELMNEAKHNAREKIKKTHEKFNALTQDEANIYLNKINFLNYWIQNNSGNKGIMEQINTLVQNANTSRIENKKNLVNILTNMYSMAYLDFINHQNSESYKVYAKYSNPKNNKFYTQYLHS